MVEPMGADTQVTMTLAGTSIHLLLRQRIKAAPGDALEIGIPPELVHLFDTRTGQRAN